MNARLSAFPDVTGLVTLVDSVGLHAKRWLKLDDVAAPSGCVEPTTLPLSESSFILTCKFCC